MAIRKDLDDMLNNLKKSGGEEIKPKPTVNTSPEPRRKSIYDDMSIDDLLNALTVEKKPSLAENIINELDAAEAAETVKEPEPPIAVQEGSAPVKIVIEETIAVEKPKKKIVINHELPDYEAIRRQALEEDKLRLISEEEAAQTEVPAADDTGSLFSEELEIQKNVPETQAEETAGDIETSYSGYDEAVDNSIIEFAEPVENEIVSDEETEDAETAEDLLNAAIAAINCDPEDETEPFSEPDEFSFAEADEVSVETDETELDDIEISDVFDEPELSDVISEDEEAEEAAEEAAEPENEGDTDSVSELIEDIRENAANAIAEIDKPKEPEKEEKAEEAAEEAVRTAAEEKAEKAGKIAKALENILSENPDELIAVHEEHVEDDETLPAVKEKGKVKKRVFTILGVVFTVFAVIGIITVGIKAVKIIKSFTTGEVKKDGFTEVIYPAVIMDIESFNSPSELTSEQLITASVWSIIMDEDEAAKYPLNAGGDTISISAYDVEAKAVELFGEDHQPFEHTTVGKAEPKFFYDTETGAYNVKVKPIVFTYKPEIKSIVKSGNTYKVSVDYIDELPSWMEDTVAKSVEFQLTERDDGTYRIDSMSINYVNNSN